MKKILGIVLCYIFLTLPLFASDLVPTTALGTIQKNNITLNFNGYTIDTYKVLDGYYVPISSLKDLGLNVAFTAESGVIQIDQSTTSTTPSPTTTSFDFAKKPFSLYEKDIWIGHFKTLGILSEGRVLIPIGALRTFYTVVIDEPTSYDLIPKEPLAITVTKDQIINQTDYPIVISGVDLYWGGTLVNPSFEYLLGAGETLSRPAASHTEKYITSVITKVVSQSPEKTLNYINDSMLGQTHEALFRRNDKLQALGNGTDLGDPIDIDTLLWAEDTINSKHLASSTPYLVWTNIDKQRTYIFEGSKDHWTLIKHFKCSTGRSGCDTPKGQYQLTQKVPYFGVQKGYRCKNAFGFIGTTYLYHSVMFDKTGTYLLQGRGTLGKKASSGCIRLSVEHSEWFYANMVSHTTVLIN